MKELERDKLKMNLQLFAEDNSEGKTDDDKGKEEDVEGKGSSEKKEATKTDESGKEFTQADMDKTVKDRLARENKKFQKQLDDLKKQFSDGGAEDTASGESKGDEDTRKTELLLATANQRLLEATATTEAVKLGVDPKYIADVVRLANLDELEIGEDGLVDTGAVSKQIDEVLKRVPVFKTTSESEGGFKVGGEGKKTQNTNSWNTNSTKATGTEQNVKRWNRQNR